ncbi:hypothetical protein Plav_0933 [Parvibaculum lavamentivorans DS-1]|uniref:Uncharacterized protein n=1 Tax=Parvibaculum lavamentivorans (strain DS-1 / DSM 13023 / NCIMB 13966) TaxID=402881 RepID=A7HRM3_PARL1|nr:hypothetical protein [Parvibaculum lavamentivorans]ABS62556.1 hypothetical protein Plav_0933 [Parvibaculum lavamentivorans DS-1]
MKTEPPASIKQRLASYLAQLPPPTAVKLASGLERERLRGVTGLPYEMILSGLRPLLASFRGKRPGSPDPLRQFCQPFEDLLVDGRDGERRQGLISRASVLRVWNWLEDDLLPDALPDMKRRIVDHTLTGDTVALGATVSVMHASAASAIRSAIEEARRDATQRKQAEKQLGGESGFDDAREIAAVLSIAPAMLALQSMLPRTIENLDDATLASVKELYDTTAETSPADALYIPFAVMSRLAEPSQILRFVRKVAHQRNDMVISRCDLAIFGEILLAEMEKIARKADALRPGHADLGILLEDVRRFARLSRGFTAEIDLRRNGEWGQRLLAARARVSAAVSQEMSRFENELVRALPFHQMGQYGRGGPMKPDLHKAPDSGRAARMEACLRFVEGVTPICEPLGAQSHCRSVRQQVETYLAAYEDRLLEEIRVASGTARANAELFLEFAAGFHEALGEEKQAEILRRRGQVATRS